MTAQPSKPRMLVGDVLASFAVMFVFGVIGAILVVDFVMMGVFAAIAAGLGWAALRVYVAQGPEALAIRKQVLRVHLREGLLGVGLFFALCALGGWSGDNLLAAGVFAIVTVVFFGLSRMVRV